MLPSSTKTVFSFYGSDINLGWSRAIALATARRARRRIFVSRRLADRWPDERNRVIPNGIDFDEVRPLDRDECCRSLDLDPKKRWVLFGGAPDNEVKGYPEFQRILKLVRCENPLVEELVLTARSTSHESVVRKLSAADVLLFTSKQGSEGSPTIVKEAIVVGTPVVTVDVGDVNEMLAGIEPGGVVPWPANPDDENARTAWREALARQVVDVTRSPRRSDGREKRSFLREEEIARRVLAVYREAVD
jgi:glycosyltransferase involved in cell wall biosynthesis